MEKDFIMKTGRSHSLCQDYARCGEDFIFLADGCSGSLDTDWGSRLLVLGGEKCLKKNENFESRNFPNKVIHQADDDRKNLKLHPHSLDATFLGGVYNKGTIHLYAVGDGFIVMGNEKGITGWASFEYDGAMPFYLNYLLNPGRLERFRGRTGGGKIESEGTLTNWTRMEWGYYKTIEPVRGLWIALFSDGAGTFSLNREKIGWKEIIKEATAFKNKKGAFVQRRIKSFFRMNKELEHEDDFTMAALVI